MSPVNAFLLQHGVANVELRRHGHYFAFFGSPTYGRMTLEEFRPLKNELVEEKVLLTERLREQERQPTNRLEPTQRFRKSIRKATFLTREGNSEQKVELLLPAAEGLVLRKTGSQRRHSSLDYKSPI